MTSAALNTAFYGKWLLISHNSGEGNKEVVQVLSAEAGTIDINESSNVTGDPINYIKFQISRNPDQATVSQDNTGKAHPVGASVDLLVDESCNSSSSTLCGTDAVTKPLLIW